MGCGSSNLVGGPTVSTALLNEWESFQKIDFNFEENKKEWKLTGEQAEYKEDFKMTIHQRKD